MASLALGVAGAYVGGLVGGPWGAKIGFALGSYAGGMIDAPNMNGPTLSPNDLRITGSGYGLPIGKGWGTNRRPGNVFWSTPKKPTKHKVSGKGGPTATTTSYSLSCAVYVQDGLIDGVSRIWMNGKLVYDIRASNTSASGVTGNIRVYNGSETQMPDGLIVALGGYPSGYRGTAYVVFEDLQLADFGNAMPNFEFEVVENGTWSLPAADVHGVGGYCGVASPFSGLMFVGAVDAGTGLNPRIEVWDPYSANKLASIPLSFGSWAFDYCCYVEGTNEVWFSNSSPIRTTELVAFSCDTFSISRSSANVADIPYSFGSLVYVSATNEVWMPRGAINTTSMRIWDAGSMLITGTINQASIGSNRSIYVPDVDLVFISDLAGVEVWGGTSKEFLLAGSTPTGNAYAITYDSANRRIVWGTSGGSPIFYYLDVDTLALTSTAVTAPTISNIGFDSVNNRIVTYDGSSQIKLWDSSTFTLQQTISGLPGSLMHPSSPMTVLDRWVIGVGHQASASIGRVPIVNMLTSNPVPVADILTDVSIDCGLGTSDIDVSGIPDTTYGYWATGNGLVTGRTAIEMLMPAFQFDAVESDGKVKFVKRGGAIAAVIPEGKLVVDGAATAEIIRLVDAKELDLPLEVAVSYIDINADYQTGVQYSRRLTVPNKDKKNIQLPIVMTADYAKRIADILLYVMWAARNTVPLKIPPEFAYLEPTDLVQFLTSTYAPTLLLGNRTEDSTGITYETVYDDPSIYTSLATGVALPSKAANVVETKLPSWIALLDWPLLRDADDDDGFYLAGGGQDALWSGSVTYRSSDGGASYTELANGVVDIATEIGAALDVLAAFTGGNIFDESSSVTVRMLNGSTLSSTSELAVLNGANPIFIGSEFLQYKNATLNGSGDYVLTGLLRGRRGTEWAMTTHAYGERVIVPSPVSMLRISDSGANLGLERFYKEVTLGATIASAAPVRFTNTGIGKKCYSPVLLGGGFIPSGDATLTWFRRTRIGGEWRDYADALLGETTKSYSIDIYSDNTYTTVKRTLTATTQSCTYTLAQQTTDFGGQQKSIYFKVYQISDVVGRGYASIGGVAKWGSEFYSRDWNDLSVANQTLFGNSSPTETAATGACVITTAGSQGAASRLDLAPSAADFDLSVSFLATPSGKYNGIEYRTTYWNNNVDTYAYRVFGDLSNMWLYSGPNASSGSQLSIGYSALSLTAGTQHSMRIVVSGNSHQIYIDGVLKINVTDTRNMSPGQVALYAYDNTAGQDSFDNFSILTS